MSNNNANVKKQALAFIDKLEDYDDEKSLVRLCENAPEHIRAYALRFYCSSVRELYNSDNDLYIGNIDFERPLCIEGGDVIYYAQLDKLITLIQTRLKRLINRL